LEVAASLSQDLFDPGYRHLPHVFAREQIAGLNPILAAIPSHAAGRRWAGHDLAALLRNPAMQTVVQILDRALPEMAVIRAVAFRKDAEANWLVPPHQDRSIPVPSANLLPGFDNLTRKDGGWQAEAPEGVLQRMRNCRIFIDAATVDDGPLEVVPGSHRRGRILQSDIPAIVARGQWHPIIGAAGDLVVLSPLLLHRSRRAAVPSGRRVLQLECLPVDLAAALHLDAHAVSG
jgi:ectoine hydroxylase-related dioxygenase (phytanoyl-CoA dioxygenase family)